MSYSSRALAKYSCSPLSTGLAQVPCLSHSWLHNQSPSWLESTSGHRCEESFVAVRFPEKWERFESLVGSLRRKLKPYLVHHGKKVLDLVLVEGVGRVAEGGPLSVLVVRPVHREVSWLLRAMLLFAERAGPGHGVHKIVKVGVVSLVELARSRASGWVPSRIRSNNRRHDKCRGYQTQSASRPHLFLAVCWFAADWRLAICSRANLCCPLPTPRSGRRTSEGQGWCQ